MLQRKDDAVIVEVNHKIDRIHERLNALENLSDEFREVKEWIATVVKITRIMEVIGDFLEKWILRFAKLAALCATIWLSFKIGIAELRSYFLK